MKTTQQKREYLKNYYQNNKDKIKERSKQRYVSHKDECKLRSANQRLKNPAKYKAYLKNWRELNKAYLNEQAKIRLKTQPYYRLRNSISNAIRKKLMGRIKTSKSIEYIGCTFEFLVGWLESKFDDNMSWNNYGSYWHIDHRIPCRAFDLTSYDQLKQCFNYTNLQPMEASENCRKQDRLPNNNLARNEITKRTS